MLRKLTIAFLVTAVALLIAARLILDHGHTFPEAL